MNHNDEPEFMADPELGEPDWAVEARDTHPCFYLCWTCMTELGQCDGWGGMECYRVYNEWLRDGRPEDIDNFIRARANT